MASLRQTLKGLPQADDQMVRGPSGVLQRGPTLQQATKRLGVASAPTTPMGAEMLGVSPQVSKMAGTPQQMQATLQTALRQKQYGREATEAEAAVLTKSADMQKLGGLGDRVTNLISAQKKEQVTPPAGTPEAIEAQRAAGTVADIQFEGKPVSGVAEALEELRTLDPITDAARYNELLNQVNTYFGRTPTNLLTTEDLNKLYKTSSDIIQSTTQQIQLTEPTVQELTTDPSFGYTLPQLSELLEIPAEQLATYTTKQLQDTVNQLAAQEFTQVQQLRQQATSPLVGAAERQLAREAARELSAIGIAASEADIAGLLEDISSARTVTFNNEQYTIDQLAGDDFISSIIKDYIDSPVGSEFRKQLDASEPELSQFIATHMNALTAATKNMKAGAEQFGNIQQANIDLIRSSFGNLELDPKVQEALVPGSTKLSNVPIDPSTSPILSYLQTKTDNERKSFANNISAAATLQPSVASEIANLTPEQLKNLNIENNGKRWKDYNTVLDNNKRATNLEPTETNALLALYSPNILSAEQVNADLQTNATLNNLGFADKSYTTGTLPLVKGKLDTATLKDTFLAANPLPTVADAADNKLKNGTFSYKTPILPAAGSAQANVLNDWGDFGRSGRVPTAQQVLDRIQTLLGTTRNTVSSTLANAQAAGQQTPSPLQFMINELKEAGTWSKWKLTDADEKLINDIAMGQALKIMTTTGQEIITGLEKWKREKEQKGSVRLPGQNI
jgi:hypothetical protein